MLVIVVGILLAINYSRNLQAQRLLTETQAFEATVSSMENISTVHLRTQQEYVNNWASYINSSGFTMEEAMQMLYNINTNSSVSAHIIDPYTLQGYSTRESTGSAGSYTVDYSAMPQAMKLKIYDIAQNMGGDADFRITEAYTDPIDGQPVVSFGRRIFLADENGTKKCYVLLRVMKMEALQKQWVFPSGYKGEADIALITKDGDYVLPSESMEGENFCDFLSECNGLTADEAGWVEALLKSGEEGILEYKGANGQLRYWAYVPIGASNDWVLVGSISADSFEPDIQDWKLVYMVCSMLSILLIMDGLYFVYINSRLRESVAAANEASKAKTRFLASMSHDIRTPMNAVVGMTAVAMRNIDDKERVHDCLKKITLASGHLLTLINDILDISKVESGQFALNPAVFSLPDLMTNLTNIVRPQISAKSLDFKAHVINLHNEYLYADELRLNQIYINILSNAVKYTPVGGSITLTLEQQPVPDEPKAVRVIYTVADTGMGMSEEFMKNMFQPFVRERDDKVDTVEGSGLGLAITKSMVDIMGGTIDVQSELGKGSVFKVTLELPVAEKLTDDIMLPPMRMLVVDDDEIFLETAEDMLISLGIKPDTAQSGAQAVSMVKAEHEKGLDYPVVIVDWKMPEMDGVATIRAIRAIVGKEVSIIILSAFDWSDIEQEALEAGANGFISKPMFRSGVYAKVMQLLNLQQEPQPKEEKLTEDFKGMHLLVAEDNDMNWEIIAELLGMYGITADWARNGSICVQMLTSAPKGTYEAVLMDVQMPVMGGLEATRFIRQSEIDYVRDIPIIAMTANAFAEDVRSCLGAGMNAHVTKPVDMKLLLAKLDQVRKGTL